VNIKTLLVVLSGALALLLGACSSQQAQQIKSVAATVAAAITPANVQAGLTDAVKVAKPLLSNNEVANLKVAESVAQQVAQGKLPASQLVSAISKAAPQSSAVVSGVLASASVALAIADAAAPGDTASVEAYASAVYSALVAAGI
jgi:UTP-glucose-1-phosphate uridylyltransferase